jgi:hypothetical protein
MAVSLETIDRRLLSVLSEWLIVLLSLPDPPPEARNFSTISAIYQLAGTLTDEAARREIQSVAGKALTSQIGQYSR